MPVVEGAPCIAFGGDCGGRFARMFPVHEGSRRRVPSCPRSVPWGVLASHERQAVQNHSQSLERLAERGGLDLVEMVCVLTDVPWRAVEMTEREALPVVLAAVAEYVARSRS
jgi:hypothetical protein